MVFWYDGGIEYGRMRIASRLVSAGQSGLGVPDGSVESGDKSMGL